MYCTYSQAYKYTGCKCSLVNVQWINVHVLVLGLCVFTRSSVHCTPSPLQDCTMHCFIPTSYAPLHHCKAVTLHQYPNAPLHQCTTELLRYCTIASRHRCTTARLHRCITAKPPHRSIAPRHLAEQFVLEWTIFLVPDSDYRVISTVAWLHML